MDGKKLMEMSEVEFKEALADLRKTNQEQADYAKRAWTMSLLSTIVVFLVALFIIGYCMFLLPRVTALLDEAQVSLQNIESITTEVAKLDIEGLMNDVGDLVTTTQEDLGTTMSKIEEIDFEGLNTAVQNLSDIVQPMADFFKKIGTSGGSKTSSSSLNLLNVIR